eukprot:TRINITY_DN55736_c0_g1_i1.p1 TRINITY_DN55736_c0_g1~~TRINITY_DN55736_c0_g1_i1.p1  ORF type:complete len:674 (+),score=183.10 TRINITY_DN55736_c0_g1_i1:127-2022(+)
MAGLQGEPPVLTMTTVDESNGTKKISPEEHQRLLAAVDDSKLSDVQRQILEDLKVEYEHGVQVDKPEGLDDMAKVDGVYPVHSRISIEKPGSRFSDPKMKEQYEGEVRWMDASVAIPDNSYGTVVGHVQHPKRDLTVHVVRVDPNRRPGRTAPPRAGDMVLMHPEGISVALWKGQICSVLNPGARYASTEKEFTAVVTEELIPPELWAGENDYIVGRSSRVGFARLVSCFAHPGRESQDGVPAPIVCLVRVEESANTSNPANGKYYLIQDAGLGDMKLAPPAFWPQSAAAIAEAEAALAELSGRAPKRLATELQMEAVPGQPGAKMQKVQPPFVGRGLSAPPVPFGLFDADAGIPEAAPVLLGGAGGPEKPIPASLLRPNPRQVQGPGGPQVVRPPVIPQMPGFFERELAKLKAAEPKKPEPKHERSTLPIAQQVIAGRGMGLTTAWAMARGSAMTAFSPMAQMMAAAAAAGMVQSSMMGPMGVGAAATPGQAMVPVGGSGRGAGIVPPGGALPADWSAVQDPTTKQYFFRNRLTGQVQWTHPTSSAGAAAGAAVTTPATTPAGPAGPAAAPAGAQPPAGSSTWADIQARQDVPEGWDVMFEPNQSKYFYKNSKTGSVQWEKPTKPGNASI